MNFKTDVMWVILGPDIICFSDNQGHNHLLISTLLFGIMRVVLYCENHNYHFISRKLVLLTILHLVTLLNNHVSMLQAHSFPRNQIENNCRQQENRHRQIKMEETQRLYRYTAISLLSCLYTVAVYYCVEVYAKQKGPKVFQVKTNNSFSR